MTSKVAKPRPVAKSGRGRIVPRKSTIVPQIHPAILKLREILRCDISMKDASYALAAVLKRPPDSCKKLLNGSIPLNAESLTVLMQSAAYGEQVYAAVMDAAPHPAWYASRREDISVFDLAKDVAAQQRRVDQALKVRMGQ